MKPHHGERIAVALLMLMAAAIFTLGISWGLPSRNTDVFLFGDHPIWSGEQIARLAGERGDEKRGADVDVNPVVRGEEPVVLNDTDAKRAEIVRRYRLFTYQPDEMITLMSLASMKPGEGDFDPKLYQYGGLWIYPVGALVKLVAGGSSQTFYMDHPEQFARFYVVARLYAAAWGVVGVWVVFRLAKNAGGGMIGAIGAAMLYVFLPVVVNMSHEAKPHLPGAVLVMLAALAAGKFVETGGRRWWIAAGVLCGSAAGMILSAAVAIVMLPAMVMMRQMSWKTRVGICCAAGAAAIGVYFITNPYVLLHLWHERSILASNLGNSAAMYQVGKLGEGFVDAVRLVAAGASPVTVVVGVLGAIFLFRGTAKPQAGGLRLLVIVAIAVFVQFIALAAGKPGEYGRFALVTDVALAIAAAVWIGRANIRRFEQIEVIGVLVLLTLLPSVVYLRGFLRDSGQFPQRMEDAQLLAILKQMGAQSIGVYDEPAPYLLPAVDVFDWKILLLPRGFDLASGQTPADVIVRPVDELRARGLVGKYEQVSQRRLDDVLPARISWANKGMEIWVRTDLRDQ